MGLVVGVHLTATTQGGMMHKVLFAMILIFASASCSRDTSTGNGNATAVGKAIGSGCNRNCRAAIQRERAKLKPISYDLLPHVRREYAKMIELTSPWRFYARRCSQFAAHFRKVEELTLYPESFVGGIALHESRCAFGDSDWAGGRGFMQITHVDRRRHLEPIAKMLHIPVETLDYRRNVLHNVLTGVMILDDYERQLGSRPHGILAYNMGPGGVRSAIRRSGRGGLPSVAELMPHLAYTRRMKPRVYVQKVLASVVLYDRAARGAELAASISSRDIPGWDPGRDGS